MAEKADTTASVLAQIAAYGPFLPGSVRETTTKKALKDGTVRAYAAQPIYTWTDPATGRQRCRRIPKAAFKQVRELTLRYKGMKKLVARFEAAAVAENLDAASKKNSSR